MTGDTETFVLADGEAVEFVWIDAGTFLMGSPSGYGYEDERPQHEVTITRGFWLGKYEVTQGQWEAMTGTTPWSGKDFVQANPEHPAVYISWDDVQGALHQLNQAAGDSVYRLPTEAEWEYACRAGTRTIYSFGDYENQLGEHAWYSDNAWAAGLKCAQPVGQKWPNPWGLYDMHGNVFEWVQDWKRTNGNGEGFAGYAANPQTDPAGPETGRERVCRGGSFAHWSIDARSASRHATESWRSQGNLGVRLLRTE